MPSAFGDETSEPDEEIQVVERHKKNEETVELLQRQVATEIEHNKTLREEKRRLEESVQSESAKRAKMEESCFVGTRTGKKRKSMESDRIRITVDNFWFTRTSPKKYFCPCRNEKFNSHRFYEYGIKKY